MSKVKSPKKRMALQFDFPLDNEFRQALPAKIASKARECKGPCRDPACANAHPADHDAFFDSSWDERLQEARHDYFVVRGSKVISTELLSVTTVAKCGLFPFNAARKAQEMQDKGGDAAAVTLATWGRAAALGTQLHDKIEKSFAGETNGLPHSDPRFRMFLRFMNRWKWPVVRLEMRLRSKRWPLVGSPDAIFLINGKLYIIDWKRTRNVLSTRDYGTRGPHIGLCAPKRFGYDMQINLYRRILNRNYDLEFAPAHDNTNLLVHCTQLAPTGGPVKCGGGAILNFPPDGNEFIFLPVPDMEDEVECAVRHTFDRDQCPCPECSFAKFFETEEAQAIFAKFVKAAKAKRDRLFSTKASTTAGVRRRKQTTTTGARRRKATTVKRAKTTTTPTARKASGRGKSQKAEKAERPNNPLQLFSFRKPQSKKRPATATSKRSGKRLKLVVH